MNKRTIWDKEPELRRTCMLMITHQCNLNCSYCYENYKSDLKMDFETAISCIKTEETKVKRSKKVVGLEIDLMGGEPMTNFSLIKRLVEWAEEGNIKVPYIFSMTTNGTLFEEQEQKWFKKHKGSIICSLSFDGNSQMQETNRGAVSKNADINFFCKTWSFQGLHMTISNETLPNMADGIINIQKRGYLIEASLAEGIDWQENAEFLYKRELEKLADFYLENPSIKPINTLLRYLNVVEPEKDKKKIKKFCGTGTYMIAYEPDGKTYGCHMFTPLVLGDKAIELKKINYKCNKTVEDKICNKCILKHFCPTCAGFNYRYRNNLGTRDKRKCVLHLQEAIVSAKFQLKLIAQRKNILSLEDAQHAYQAQKALNILNKCIKHNGYPYNL